MTVLTISLVALSISLVALAIAIRAARKRHIVREEYHDRYVFRDQDGVFITSIKK